MSKENQIIEMLEAMNHKLNIIQKQVNFISSEIAKQNNIPSDDETVCYNPVFSTTMGELYDVMLIINRQKDNPTLYPEYRESVDNYISGKREF